MKIEYEVRVLEINPEEMIKKLEDLGATKNGEYDQKRYTYDLNPKDQAKWIRLRTNGEVTTLTLKNIENTTITGTKELEIEVSSFEDTQELLERIGFKYKAYQENKRIQYILDGVELDIDTWPLIPTYMEIEGKSVEDVEKIIEKLELDRSKITSLDVKAVYDKKYGIDIDEIPHLKF